MAASHCLPDGQAYCVYRNCGVPFKLRQHNQMYCKDGHRTSEWRCRQGPEFMRAEWRKQAKRQTKRRAETAKKWREFHRKAGNCVRCGQPLDGERTAVCDGCLTDKAFYKLLGDYDYLKR